MICIKNSCRLFCNNTNKKRINKVETLQTVVPGKTFEYGTTRIRNIKINSSVISRGKYKFNQARSLTINDGPEIIPTKRFWTSIQCRFGFSANVFRYFSHAEVFDRVSTLSANDLVKYCIEKSSDGSQKMLAVTNPNTATIREDQLNELLNKYGSNKILYSNGIVSSVHTPKIGSNSFDIAGDTFCNEFCIDTPIDGFGKPSIFLALLRLVCANGSIALTKAFRSEISVGKNDKDVTFSLTRALDGFNNEEGFAALRNRFEAAAKSWASVNEAQKIYRLLSVLANNNGLKKIGRETIQTTTGTEVIETALPILNKFHAVTGDISHIYGLANLDTLSIKRQRTLPIGCKVYDLLNFMSEVSSHLALPDGARRLNALSGDLVSSEYDLEDTASHFSDWRDFFIDETKQHVTI